MTLIFSGGGGSWYVVEIFPASRDEHARVSFWVNWPDSWVEALTGRVLARWTILYLPSHPSWPMKTMGSNCIAKIPRQAGGAASYLWEEASFWKPSAWNGTEYDINAARNGLYEWCWNYSRHGWPGEGEPYTALDFSLMTTIMIVGPHDHGTDSSRYVQWRPLS